ncbi:MAG: PTS sugar transporter subunit IIC [Deltaproteobacteria bacterium]|nr:PTS sugar transporter subunit IIC [Deltaproteobacteria bacterium]
MLFFFYLSLLLGSIINFDRQACAQTMISRPLPTGLLVGLAAGLPQEGLTLGLWAELIFLSRSPLGGALLPNGSLAVSSSLCSLALLNVMGFKAPPSSGDGLLVLAFAALPPLSHLAAVLDALNRGKAVKKIDRIKNSLTSGARLDLFSLNLSALPLTLLLSAAFIAISSFALALIITLVFSLLGPAVILIADRLAPLMPLCGLSFMLANLKLKELPSFSVAIMATLTLFWLKTN